MALIHDFKSKLTGGGARANHFRVTLSFPSFVASGTTAANRAQFLCKSAQLPASTIEDIAVQYRGRAVHVAGERTFAPWTINVYNDNDFLIRNAFERWAEKIQNLGGSAGLLNPADYQMTMQVDQLDRNDVVLKTYNFIDAYPTEVGAIELDFDSANAIELFPVTLQYNYWTASDL